MAESKGELSPEQVAELKEVVEEVTGYKIYGDCFVMPLSLDSVFGELRRMKREVIKYRKLKAAMDLVRGE